LAAQPTTAFSYKTNAHFIPCYLYLLTWKVENKHVKNTQKNHPTQTESYR